MYGCTVSHLRSRQCVAGAKLFQIESIGALAFDCPWTFTKTGFYFSGSGSKRPEQKAKWIFQRRSGR
jgi:hypothetical protein